jgi:O-antigen ligase
MMNKLLNWLIILLPLALPLYVVRFNIGPLPTTLLEVYVLALMVTWLLSRVNSGQWSETDKSPSPSPSSQFPVPISHIRSSLFEIRSSIGKWFWPLIVWLVVTLIAVFVAQDAWAAFGHWRAFMLEPVIVFVALIDSLAGRPHGVARTMERLLQAVAMATILLGVYAAFQYITGWGIPSPWDAEAGRRATGVFGYPNGLSLFIVPFGVVSWMRLADAWLSDHMGSPLQLLMYGSASALALVATVLAKSMGGILAFGVGVVLTLIILKKTRVIGIVLTVLGVLGAGLVAWQIYGTELHPQTIEDNLASTKKWSSSVRVIIWQESWEIIKDNPILGTGLRSYKTAVIPYHQATWMEIFPHPHNIFLMLWIETGLAGLLAFIWLIVTWVAVVKGQKINDKSYERLIWIVPLIAILVHGMVDMPYFKNDLAIQFFLLAALATTCNTKLTMHNA